MKAMTLTVVIITMSCLLILLSPHVNAKCSVSCSDDKKRCTTACLGYSPSAEQMCINNCYDQHNKCQNNCLAVAGRFLRRDEGLLDEWYPSNSD